MFLYLILRCGSDQSHHNVLSRAVLFQCHQPFELLVFTLRYILRGHVDAAGYITYGKIQTVEELGRLARAHRKQRRLTLETVSGLGNLSRRFLSKFVRGKETAEIGKVLKALRTLGLEAIIQPRGRPAQSAGGSQRSSAR